MFYALIVSVLLSDGSIDRHAYFHDYTFADCQQEGQSQIYTYPNATFECTAILGMADR
ncbi:hypothetical protein [Larsenimonas suaedae]|uniref:Uncharacterized protein n=1 Tax=Larsenimonas suaedae TaxID=1851019 RepID=A0ABU1GYZ3_9GAMM|nr:hypothetical protein [Larsenimonas suaedae]MCM2973742.1 hypothetical protein [Larsenimonas suaedae]MDR5897266.1 hypothetical protein [Larsenimonas suaedae]